MISLRVLKWGWISVIMASFLISIYWAYSLWRASPSGWLHMDLGFYSIAVGLCLVVGILVREWEERFFLDNLALLVPATVCLAVTLWTSFSGFGGSRYWPGLVMAGFSGISLIFMFSTLGIVEYEKLGRIGEFGRTRRFVTVSIHVIWGVGGAIVYIWLRLT